MALVVIQFPGLFAQRNKVAARSTGDSSTDSGKKIFFAMPFRHWLLRMV